MINKLKEINNRLINIYENSPIYLKKQLLIKEMLKNPKCFFDIDIETAYKVLTDLKIPEDKINAVYLELIDSNNYLSTENEEK